MEELVRYYRLTKVSNIVAGGKTGQESIWNGLKVIKEFTDDDDIVLIHDGVRPVITEQLITDNIESVRKHGNGISACFAWGNDLSGRKSRTLLVMSCLGKNAC